jgi:hypothetical protein
MKIFLVIFLTSLVILALMFFLNAASYNGTSRHSEIKKSNDKN